MSLLDRVFRKRTCSNEASLLSSQDGPGNEIKVFSAGEFSHVVVAPMVVGAGRSEQIAFSKHVPWIIAGVILILAADFIPGWGTARTPHAPAHFIGHS